MKDGLTTDELLGQKFTILAGGTEAGDGKMWKFHCGGCYYWQDHVNHGLHPDYPLCDRCKVGLESFSKWAAVNIYEEKPPQ